MPNRPLVIFPLGVEVSPAGAIVAPYAVLVMAADESEQDAPRAPSVSKPTLAKCLPSNVVALHAARRSA